jgi:hypothetical protein
MKFYDVIALLTVVPAELQLFMGGNLIKCNNCGLYKKSDHYFQPY